MGAIGIVLIVAVLGAVFLFLVFRRFWLWYFKISEIVRILDRIAWSLEQMPAVRDAKLRQGSRKKAA